MKVTINPIGIQERVDLLNEEAWRERNTNTQRALELAQEACGIAEKANSLNPVLKSSLAQSIRIVALCNQLLSNYKDSLTHCLRALDIFGELNDEKGIASVFSCMGTDYFLLGAYDESLIHHFKALKLREKLNSEEEQSSSLLNIANVYASNNDYERAENYYLKSEEIAKGLKDKALWAKVLNGIGGLYMSRSDNEKAIECFIRSATLKTDTGELRSAASTLHNMGTCYIELKDFVNAQECLKESMRIAVQFGDRTTEGVCLQTFGRLFLVQDRLPEAIDQLNRALYTFEDLNGKKDITECNRLLAEAYKKLGDYKTAYQHLDKHYRFKEQLAKLESAKQIENITLADEIKTMQVEAKLEKIKNQQLQQANTIIAEKNSNILDSIEYAKYIQESLLSTEEDLKESFPASFVFFKPKDIVSGDFYFHYRMGSIVLFAVVDCTGHGVPGAFMSLAGNNMIEHIIKVKKIYEPSLVLNELNNVVSRQFKNEDERITLKSGMDIGFCLIDLDALTLRFAGTHNSVYLLRSGGLIELRAERIALGNKSDQEFVEQSYALEKNDVIYLFTDGFADQKGGEHRRKYYYPPFKELLTRLSATSMDGQKTGLEAELKAWMKEGEANEEHQIDDVTVIGLKV